MSVRVGDRPLSRIEFIYQANNIYDIIQDLCFRDFGIHSKKSIFRKHYLNNLKYYDEQQIDNIINSTKQDLQSMSKDLCRYLKIANGLFPRSKLEYEIRLTNIDKALACCLSLLDSLNSFARTFKSDISVFKNVVIVINYEIDLIKRLKNSDRKRFGQLL